MADGVRHDTCCKQGSTGTGLCAGEARVWHGIKELYCTSVCTSKDRIGKYSVVTLTSARDALIYAH